MNWNGQQPYNNHLLALRTDPANAKATQDKFDAFRLKRAQEGSLTRPAYIPLSFNLLAAGQVPPFRCTTTDINFDVVITHIKTDLWPARDIEIKIGNREQQFVRVADSSTTFLKSDEIMGHSVDAGGGQVGAFPLPVPIVIPAQQRVSVGVFKPGADAADINANIVLIGYRVIANNFIDTYEMEKIRTAISRRTVPELRFIEMPVTFSGAGGIGTIDTNNFSQPVDEPLLILGCRSDLRLSQAEIGLQGEARWTQPPVTNAAPAANVGLACPSWGIAAETELGYDDYQWYLRPVLLHSNSSIEMPRIVNGIDGAIPDAATGRFTFLCTTV